MAHYRTLLLARLETDHVEAPSLRGAIVADYARLRTLDPDRARRYADLERAASL